MLFSIIGVIKNKSGVSLFELTGTYVRYGLFHCFYMQKKPKKTMQNGKPKHSKGFAQIHQHLRAMTTQNI